ncbi:MAG: acetyl-CoA hydrolase-like protein [Frankiales bacterium]|nr:acetyl-CoA hydrolase-like protein [Frankiales bacterium]
MRVVNEAQLGAALGRCSGSDTRVVCSGNFATPRTALAVVDEHLPAYRLFVLNAQHGVPERAGVVHETPFVGPGVRHSSRLAYVPARLSLVPGLFASAYRPDVVVLHTTPPRGGHVSLGIEVNILPAAIEQARQRGGLVIAQVNPQMPWTRGDAEVSTDLVDLVLEVDEPLVSPALRPPSDLESVIGGRVAALVHDGATLQIGIGGVPDAVMAALTERRGLRVWSEMVSDGVLGLVKADALDPVDELVTSFLFGSPELYAWAADNPQLRMLRTELTNDPAQIARRPAMTSINSALQVDLYDQANATWAGTHVHSGFGGQSDFVVGALHAPNGLAVVALPSWHPKADRSTIVPVLDTPVTSFQHSWVVTEQGSAAVWPGTTREQARQLIGVAHPQAQDSLREEAGIRGLL